MTTSPLPEQLLPEQHKIRLLSEPRGPAAPGSSVAWHQQFLHMHILRSLEAVQDMISVSLCVGLFWIMALQLKEIFASLLNQPQFHAITADILLASGAGGLPVSRHRRPAASGARLVAAHLCGGGSGSQDLGSHPQQPGQRLRPRSVGAPPPFCSGRHQDGLHRC
jgi:hypothetical protein